MGNIRPLPWSGTCFVCGDENPRGLDAKFHVDRAGVVVLETTVDRCFEGYGGHVHGGILTALLDEAAGWAVSHALGRFAMTIELTVRFRRPIAGGSVVNVSARYVDKVGRFHHAKAEMTDSDGRIVATADGRFMPVTESLHEEVVPLLKMPGRAATADDV